MNVILIQKGGQVAAAAVLFAWLAGGVVQAESFAALKAVNTNGVSTWAGSLPFTLTGVLLCDPGEMLDATPQFLPWNNGANAYAMGSQWQVFLQAVQPGDRGGVECWMAQNYGNLPWEPHDGSDSYTNEAWAAEVNRVSHDPATGYGFRKGDLVTVTANGSLFYGGMQNINEEHSVDTAYNFSISLVSSNYGLPTPEVLSLSSVLSTNEGATGHYDIFDPTRATGGEHWQGMRVRINGLTLATTNGWNTNLDWGSRYCTATDGEGRQFPLIHPLYDLGPVPANRFDATGVFLQESGSGTDGTFGYELFVQEVAPSADAVLSIATLPVISWPGSLSNYQLQYKDSLSASNSSSTVRFSNLFICNVLQKSKMGCGTTFGLALTSGCFSPRLGFSWCLHRLRRSLFYDFGDSYPYGRKHPAGAALQLRADPKGLVAFLHLHPL